MYRLYVALLLSNICNTIYTNNNQMTPRISIITSLYKAEKFLESFMEDIVQQTIFDQCELILINAHSPENEKKIIEPYLDKYPNILYLELEQDPGLYAIWNLAIELSRGHYLTNANADDRIRHDCYELCADALDKNPEYDLIYSDFYLMTEICTSFSQAEEAHAKHLGLVACSHLHPFSFNYLRVTCLPNAHPMWRKSMHKNYGLFDEKKFKISGDHEFWLRAAAMGSQFYKLDRVLGAHYVNQEGLSLNPKNREQIKLESMELHNRINKLLSRKYNIRAYLPYLFHSVIL